MEDLNTKTLKELKEIAKNLNFKKYSSLNKDQLINLILENSNTNIKEKETEEEAEVYLITDEDAEKILREEELENDLKEEKKQENTFSFKKVMDNIQLKNKEKKEEELKKLKEEPAKFIKEEDFKKLTDKKLQEIQKLEALKEEEKIKKQSKMKEVKLDNGKTIKLNPETDDIVVGYADILRQGYGFVRSGKTLQSTDDDVYLGEHLIDQFSIKSGDKLQVLTRENSENKHPGVIYVISLEKRTGKIDINTDISNLSEDKKIDSAFNNLTPLYSYKRLILENNPKEISSRMIDLVSPIGLGQRALLVSPPKAGKTTLLKHIAKSIKVNDIDNDISLIMLLIDERPEEVTDIKRNIKGKVYSSTFDMSPENHIEMAEKTILEAKKLVLEGKDVVILLDSITRLARAYNIIEPSSGKILSGGFDPVALYKPKKFFGAARQTEEAGSLTIIATALVDTGSKMDDFIFEEFKGTGNMEIILDRSLAESRIFPAINLKKSGTRREELLLTKEELTFMEYVRSSFASKDDFNASKDFISLIKNYDNNDNMVNELLNAFNNEINE